MAPAILNLEGVISFLNAASWLVSGLESGWSSPASCLYICLFDGGIIAPPSSLNSSIAMNNSSCLVMLGDLCLVMLL